MDGTGRTSILRVEYDSADTTRNVIERRSIAVLENPWQKVQREE